MSKKAKTKKRKNWLFEGIVLWIVSPLVNLLYKVWCSSLRFTVEGREKVDELQEEGSPMMFCLWHDEFFPVMHVRGNLRIVTVVSRSRDAEYLAHILRKMNFITVRGSSSKGGAAALRRCARMMHDHKYNGCITIDGPRGPRHVVKPGAVSLAINTPAQVVPIRLFMQKPLVFNSWDRFQLPLPFSRVRVIFGEPYTIDATAESASSDVVQRECERLRDVLDAMQPNDAKAVRWKNTACFTMLKKRFLALLAAAAGALSRKNLHRIGDAIGFALWHAAPSRRKASINALQRHLHLPRTEAVRLARNSFRENGRSFAEICHTGKFFTDTCIRAVYSEETKRLLREETAPIVIATAHLGSWELMPGLASDLLPEREGMVIVRRQPDPEINELMATLRGARGMLVIDHRRASRTVLPKLRKGGVAAFLVDHNSSRKEAVFLPFLEDTAAVNIGPAMLALRAKATVFPLFLVRDNSPEGRKCPEKGHILHILPPLRTTELEGSIEEKTRRIAEFYTNAVAEMVRLYPEQWLWMHKRWKTREGR